MKIIVISILKTKDHILLKIPQTVVFMLSIEHAPPSASVSTKGPMMENISKSSRIKQMSVSE